MAGGYQNACQQKLRNYLSPDKSIYNPIQNGQPFALSNRAVDSHTILPLANRKESTARGAFL
jgi:hypothetical protein